MPDKPVIAIIGAGSLGIAVANLLGRNGYRVIVGSRDRAETAQKLTKLSIPPAETFELLTPAQAASKSDISLLTVPDKHIAGVCDKLLPHFKRGSCVAHCAGSLDSSELLSAKQQNNTVCSIHPLNTFPSLAASLRTLANNDHGTYLYGEGDQSALDVINPVFKAIGFETRVIPAASKPLYHAACVFACNYLTVLMDLSLQTAASGDLDRKTFWQALQPLITKTIENISDTDIVTALSGPVARADTSTIDIHASALAKVSGPLAATYLDLGQHALELAIRRGELNQSQISALQKALAKERN